LWVGSGGASPRVATGRGGVGFSEDSREFPVRCRPAKAHVTGEQADTNEFPRIGFVGN
jgi:hypothetical protein